MKPPKLRDSKRKQSFAPFELNEIPNDVICKMASHLVYLIYTGRKDISGDDWGDALAQAIGGHHLASPLGIADVALEKIAWSAKTVKCKNPFAANSIRLISGRCSPDYSYGINNPHEDIQKTGTAVLNIWNERINIAQDNYASVRTSILIRSYDLSSYVLFEEENHRYRTSDYEWRLNKNGNLVGYLVGTDKPAFTWQPHGSQFTIHADVPTSAKKFKIKLPQALNKQEVLEALKFDSSWVTFH